MTTGEKIKKRRQELHMTVDMLAEAIHKNRATIYRYENNEIKSIPLVDLEPLANALGLDPMYLAGISAEPAPAPARRIQTPRRRETGGNATDA